MSGGRLYNYLGWFGLEENTMDRKGFIKTVGLGLIGMTVLSKKTLGALPSQARFWGQEEVELFGRKATLFHWPKNRSIFLHRDSVVSVCLGRKAEWIPIEEGDFVILPPFDVDRFPLTKEIITNAPKNLGIFRVEDHPNLVALAASDDLLRPAQEDARVGRAPLYGANPQGDSFKIYPLKSKVSRT